MAMIAAVIGRLLLAAMFVISGAQKIIDPAQTEQMLASTNLPTYLAVPTGWFEVIAGIMLGVGLMTRLVSIVLAVFVAATIFFFHNEFTDQVQGALAQKNMAIIGGLLMVFAYGQMRGSYDYMRAQRRAHDAELRAARAEGRVEGATGTVEERPKRRWF